VRLGVVGTRQYEPSFRSGVVLESVKANLQRCIAVDCVSPNGVVFAVPCGDLVDHDDSQVVVAGEPDQAGQLMLSQFTVQGSHGFRRDLSSIEVRDRVNDDKSDRGVKKQVKFRNEFALLLEGSGSEKRDAVRRQGC